jgi:heterodisulfide reductase subunit C2
VIRYDAQQAAVYREKLIERVQTDVRDCYQCGNCSASCPAAFTFDLTPNQIMRLLQIGRVDDVLDSKALQLCVQCLTCSARCPRQVDIAGIIEDLKCVAAAQGRQVPEQVKTFNKAFMESIARFGQLPEMFMMAMFYLGAHNPMSAMGDAGLAIPLVIKGKARFVPKKAKGSAEVGRIYKKAMDKAAARENAEASSTPDGNGRGGKEAAA